MEKSKANQTLPNAIYSVDFSSEKPRVVISSNGTIICSSELANASDETHNALANPANKIIVCPPFKSIIISVLNPPPVSTAKQKKLIPSLLNIQLPFKLEECKYVFDKVGSKFIAQTIRNTELAETLSLASKQNIATKSVIGFIQTIWDAAANEAPSWSTESERALCIANNSSTLLVFGNNDTITATSIFNTSSSKEIIKRLKLNFKGDLSKTALFLAGEATSSILRELRDSTSPLGFVNVAKDPDYFVASACATNKNIDKFNFLSNNSKANRWDFMLSDKLKQKFAAMLLLASAFAIMASAIINANTKKIKQANLAQFNKSISQVAGYDVKLKGKRAIDEAKAAFDSRIDFSIINAEQSIITSQLFPKCIELCKKHQITLGFISINPKGVTASGSGPRIESINALVDELNANGIKCVLAGAPIESSGRFSFQLFPGN